MQTLVQQNTEQESQSRETVWCLENYTGSLNYTPRAREIYAGLLSISVSLRNVESKVHAEHVLQYHLSPKFEGR